MKTLSQNTTSSVSAPETDLQQLVATLVPDEQRISFWPQHFGLIPQWVTLEPRVFGWMDRLCEDYCGGIWNLYTLNNGGAFMAPEPDDDDDETWVLFNAMNTHCRVRFRVPSWITDLVLDPEQVVYPDLFPGS
ncbi:antirestriction protein, partial [Escherichia coli]